MERSDEFFPSVVDAAAIARQNPTVIDDASRFESLYVAYVPLLRKIATGKFGIPRADVDAFIHDVFATYLGGLMRRVSIGLRRAAVVSVMAILLTTQAAAAAGHDDVRVRLRDQLKKAGHFVVTVFGRWGFPPG